MMAFKGTRRRTFGQWLTTTNRDRGIGYGAIWDGLPGLLKIATVMFMIIMVLMPISVAVRLLRG